MAETKLADELRARRQQQAERWRSEQDELLAKAATLPDGVTVVEPETGAKVIDLMQALKDALRQEQGQEGSEP
jgi:TRAP-type C4-dicarboxylate transport system substrate-binding protein